ncbi:MAG: exodeoxyribonuclease VII small subunit [Verrucomicrobia bacterium]|nr:exodeoxyribonuclease VII small subunit [Verrucomicrobiota bacterium]
MPTTRKKSADPQPAAASGEPPAEGVKFEQALERLEKIVAEMEAAELPLDEVVKRFEEGTRLVRFCTQKLEEAGKKIEILAKQKDGTVVAEPFEAAGPDTDDAGRKGDRAGKLF